MKSGKVTKKITEKMSSNCVKTNYKWCLYLVPFWIHVDTFLPKPKSLFGLTEPEKGIWLVALNRCDLPFIAWNGHRYPHGHLQIRCQTLLCPNSCGAM